MGLSQATQEALAAQRLYSDNAERQKAIDMLLGEQAELDARLVEIRNAQSAASDTLTQAKAIKEAADSRQAGLDERESTLAEASMALNAEKDSFNTVRAQIEADLAARKEAAEIGRAQLDARETAVTDRENAVSDRESAAKASEDDLRGKHERLIAALRDNGAISGDARAD